MRMRLVPGCGPTDAKIVLIGEAPGKVEHETYEPFSGMSGNLLNQWLSQVGIAREQIRIDNLYPYLPPGGKIERVDPDTLAFYVHDLRQRIARLDSPHVVVPTGNYATFALTGKGKVKAALRKSLNCAVQSILIWILEAVIIKLFRRSIRRGSCTRVGSIRRSKEGL